MNLNESDHSTEFYHFINISAELFKIFATRCYTEIREFELCQRKSGVIVQVCKFN